MECKADLKGHTVDMQKIVENEIIEIEPQKGYDWDLDEAVAFRRQTSSNLY